MTIYPAGTDIRDITYFNRGDKVTFHCKAHTGIAYSSKDPFCSQWFPANALTRRAEDDAALMNVCCNHTLKSGVWVTEQEYNSEY